MIKITPDELTFFAGYIHDISGIYLDAGKAYLIETRLKPLMEETGVRSYRELYQRSRSDLTRSIEKKIIDAICTRETMFFRDKAPFNLLRNKIIPELIARKSSTTSFFPKPIRIWSAGCSTGQEIYSIGIILREKIPDISKFNIQLVGTDISMSAIKGATCGEYNQMNIERGLPADKLSRHFTKVNRKWRIKNEISKMCTFKTHNLKDSFAGLGRFDVIFCRNVAIYFTQKDKVNLFKKFVDILDPDGYLIIGSSESISGIDSKFEVRMYENSIYYQLICNGVSGARK